jgi:hypothetical protein
VGKRTLIKGIHKEIYPVYGGKCFSLKAIHNWVVKVTLMAKIEPEVRKWLRQQSKYLYTSGY